MKEENGQRLWKTLRKRPQRSKNLRWWQCGNLGKVWSPSSQHFCRWEAATVRFWSNTKRVNQDAEHYLRDTEIREQDLRSALFHYIPSLGCQIFKLAKQLLALGFLSLFLPSSPSSPPSLPFILFNLTLKILLWNIWVVTYTKFHLSPHSTDCKLILREKVSL